MQSHSNFCRLAQDKGVPVQAGTPFFIQKNVCKPLISLMFFMLAQPCTGKNAYIHMHTRTHTRKKEHGENVCFYPVPPVPGCATDFRVKSSDIDFGLCAS